MQNELLDDLLPEPISEEKQRWVSLLKRFAIVQVIVGIFSTILSTIEITSIMVSGPIGSSIGYMTFYFARKLKLREGTLFGLSAPALSLICLLAIALLGIGKDDATAPMPIILGIYTIILIGWLSRLLRIINKF